MLEPNLGTLTSNATDQQAALQRDEILQDFKTACLSREISLLSRREVLTGKAKFGISGDGKEIPQLAMARAFKKGDFRSGYYRDQTFMLALGLMSVEDFFAQLYADSANDPFSGGRQMNAHFATPTIDEDGNWLDTRDRYNVSADIAPTAGQMARALGIALASKKYRENNLLAEAQFSKKGQEVSFCTIGDASTSEGVFWETLNAAAVQQVPLAVFVWDDGYGISVPKEFQTAKASISEAIAGLQADEDNPGFAIHKGKGWDYPTLVEQFRRGILQVRSTHQPALFHVEEVTQPQGHSTSGSHERYKSKDRLQWEKDYDCIVQMEQWMISEGLATPEQLSEIRKDAKATAKAGRDAAWRAFNTPSKELLQSVLAIYQELPQDAEGIQELSRELQLHTHPQLHEIYGNARRLHHLLRRQRMEIPAALLQLLRSVAQEQEATYGDHLYSETSDSALRVPIIPPTYTAESTTKNGYQILNAFFDYALQEYPELYAFGEDVGQIGGVNQSFAKLQEEYGTDRVFDTGIREWTIMGQAIGMAMRGLRPIAEIQYLDYLLYASE